jgi:prolyl oligopeptidase
MSHSSVSLPLALLVAAGLAVALFWALAAAPASAAEPAARAGGALRYPAAKRGPVVDTVHGVAIPDPYRWLEDANDAATKAWMSAEDQQARDFVAKVPARDRLAERLKQIFYVDAIFSPVKRGGRFFYLRQHKEKDKAILYVRDGEHGAERVLLDGNTLTAEGTTTLGDWEPSWDGKRLAYILHPNNSDAGVLHVLDVASGKPLADTIPGADYTNVSWTPSGDGFYYSWIPSRTGKPSDADRFALAEARFHHVGSDVASDKRVHEPAGDPRLFVGAAISHDGHWLFYVISHGSTRSDVFYRDLRLANDAWHPLTSGLDALYNVDAYHDQFYVQTNEGAARSRVFRVDPAHPERSAWKEIVPERKEVVIESAAVAGKQLLVVAMKNAVHLVEVRTLDGALVRTVPLPGLGQVSQVHGDSDDDDLYLRYVSLISPPVVLHTSILKGGVDRWGDSSQPALDLSAYTVEQQFFPSKDGTQISMFVVQRKDRAKNAPAPTLLYGYGGFSIPILPAWHAELVPWLEAGGIYVAANLRGGSEYGEEWHRDGMLGKKQNVFDDFTAAAQWLIAHGYTSADKLAIWGRSNGGLLVGAAMIQHPELYRAVLCGVPLLDMVRFHLFGGGKTWTPEYGSPEEKADFQYLYAYSPYHHVKANVKYPALLMLSADADDRVEPLHARKFVASLQHAQGGSVKNDRPVLLRIERNSGHAGGDLPAYNKQLVGYWADAYAFLFHELGMK